MKRNSSNKFSFRSRAASFRYAWEGVLGFFQSQHNGVIHLAFSLLVLALIFVLKLSYIEAAVLVLAGGFVWVAEIFNTAIEKVMDHLSPEKHPSVKSIKDTAAAGVLVSAITALIAGALIFIPKIF